MPEQSALESEIAALLVETLNLEDVRAGDIVPDAPLFAGAGAGLGLDSIDALEIAQALALRYQVQLRADDERNKAIFRSLRSLSEYVQAERAPA